MGAVQLGKLSLACVMAMLAAAAVYISLLIGDRQESLSKVSRYNLAWTASQAVAELSRLEHTLATFALGNGQVDRDEVELRFDVLANRLQLLQDGEVQAFARRDPQLSQTIGDLGSAIAEIQTAIAHVEAPGAVDSMLRRLSPFDARLVSFAAAANRYGGEQVAADQRQLLRLHHLFSLLTMGLIASSLVLGALLFFQNRLLRRAHDSVRALADNLREAKDVAERAQQEAETAKEEAEHAKEEAERAKDEAVEANSAKSDFLAKMSHELRTPLNAVIGYSEMMLEDAVLDGCEEQINDLGRINSAGKHLLSLVTDVLDLSKIEAGKMEVLWEPFDVGKLIDDVLATAQPLVARNSSELVVECQPGLGTIVGDETKLRQVVLNLLSNAAKFTKGGRITMSVAREGTQWLTIAVRDTGIGISREGLEKLFGNFTQADPTISSRYGGTGLGLALSRKFCRLMRGDVTAESEVGVGSCFTVRIPVSGSNPMPLEETGENDDAPGPAPMMAALAAAAPELATEAAQ